MKLLYVLYVGIVCVFSVTCPDSGLYGTDQATVAITDSTTGSCCAVPYASGERRTGTYTLSNDSPTIYFDSTVCTTEKKNVKFEVTSSEDDLLICRSSSQSCPNANESGVKCWETGSFGQEDGIASNVGAGTWTWSVSRQSGDNDTETISSVKFTCTDEEGTDAGLVMVIVLCAILGGFCLLLCLFKYCWGECCFDCFPWFETTCLWCCCIPCTIWDCSEDQKRARHCSCCLTCTCHGEWMGCLLPYQMYGNCPDYPFKRIEEQRNQHAAVPVKPVEQKRQPEASKDEEDEGNFLTQTGAWFSRQVNYWTGVTDAEAKTENKPEPPAPTSQATTTTTTSNWNGLPPGWISQTDPQSGKEFYVNQATGKTYWERPQMVDADGDGATDYVIPSENLPQGWVQRLDMTQTPPKPFFVNTATGQTYWDPPSNAI